MLRRTQHWRFGFKPLLRWQENREPFGDVSKLDDPARLSDVRHFLRRQSTRAQAISFVKTRAIFSGYWTGSFPDSRSITFISRVRRLPSNLFAVAGIRRFLTGWLRCCIMINGKPQL